VLRAQRLLLPLIDSVLRLTLNCHGRCIVRASMQASFSLLLARADGV
jgi:hypothetical protein